MSAHHRQLFDATGADGSNAAVDMSCDVTVTVYCSGYELLQA